MLELKLEADRATEILKGKKVLKILRHRIGEFGIEFTDGKRLFLDHQPESIEISITEGNQK